MQRRVDLLAAEGVEFRTRANVGGGGDRLHSAITAPRATPTYIDVADLRRDYDALLLACGALRGRELDLPGRDLAGVHRAMEYLYASTKNLLDARKVSGTFSPLDAAATRNDAGGQKRGPGPEKVPDSHF